MGHGRGARARGGSCAMKPTPRRLASRRPPARRTPTPRWTAHFIGAAVRSGRRVCEGTRRRAPRRPCAPPARASSSSKRTPRRARTSLYESTSARFGRCSRRTPPDRGGWSACRDRAPPPPPSSPSAPATIRRCPRPGPRATASPSGASVAGLELELVDVRELGGLVDRPLVPLDRRVEVPRCISASAKFKRPVVCSSSSVTRGRKRS